MDDRMGTIHQLNPRSRASLSAVASAPSEACEIVIFPGVRIERHADTVSDAAFGFAGDDATDRDDRPRKSS